MVITGTEQEVVITLKINLMLTVVLSCTLLTACGTKANKTGLDATLPVNDEALQYARDAAENVDTLQLPNGESISFVVPSGYSRIDYGDTLPEHLLAGYAYYAGDDSDGVIVQWLWLPSNDYSCMANPMLSVLQDTGVVSDPVVGEPFLTLNGTESFLGMPIYNALDFSVINPEYPLVYLPDTFYLFGVSDDGSLVLRLQHDSKYTEDCVDFAYNVVQGSDSLENIPETFEYSEAYKTSIDSLASSLLEYTVYGDLEQIP